MYEYCTFIEVLQPKGTAHSNPHPSIRPPSHPTTKPLNADALRCSLVPHDGRDLAAAKRAGTARRNQFTQANDARSRRKGGQSGPAKRASARAGQVKERSFKRVLVGPRGNRGDCCGQRNG